MIGDGSPVTFQSIFEQWVLVEGSFQSLGIDLKKVWRTQSWRWFTVRLSFLLRTDSALQRFFADEKRDEVPDE